MMCMHNGHGGDDDRSEKTNNTVRGEWRANYCFVEVKTEGLRDLRSHSMEYARRIMLSRGQEGTVEFAVYSK